MRRYLSIIVVLAMVLSLIACGKKAEEPKEEPQAQTTDVEQVETKEDTVTDTTESKDADVNASTETEQQDELKEESNEEPEQEQPDEINAEPGTILDLYYAVRRNVGYDVEEEKIICTDTYPLLYLSTGCAEKYPELAAALDERNKLNEESSTQAIEETRGWAQEMLDENPDWFTEFYNETDYSVIRADDVVLSLEEFFSSYSGGAHGMYGVYGRNYDTKTGKEIMLEDVFVNGLGNLHKILAEKLNDEYGEDIFFTPPEEVLEDYINENGSYYTFTIGLDGITFFFQPYELASYADGLLTVSIAYDEHPGLIDEKFVTSPSEYVKAFVSSTCLADIDNDGINDEVMVYGTMGDSYIYYDKLDIYVNGTILETMDFDGVDYSALMIKTLSGDHYLYVIGDYVQRYDDIFVYKLGKSKIEYVGKLEQTTTRVSDYESEKGSSLLLNPENFCLGTCINMLGTNMGVKQYYVGKDGMPVTTDVVYKVPTKNKLTLKKDMEFDEVDPESRKTTGNKVTVKTGESLGFYESDGSTYMDMVNEDGSIIRIFVDNSSYFPYYVNGENADDIFDNILFAG